jgi:transcriptional regulator with XRE-family HTH domain
LFGKSVIIRSMLRKDSRTIAYNVRALRSLMGFTQSQLAAKAGLTLATVYRIETGDVFPHRRTLERICKVLHVEIGDLNLPEPLTKSDDVPFVIHRSADQVWTTLDDHRAHVPPDNLTQIQNPAERLRLGRSKLVAAFNVGMNFVMPKGPGLAVDEIHADREYGGSMTYRDCIRYCLRGEVLVTIGDCTYTLGEGDAIGYSNDLVFHMAPAHPLGPHDLPPLVLWVGANRMGKLPEVGRGRRDDAPIGTEP